MKMRGLSCFMSALLVVGSMGAVSVPAQAVQKDLKACVVADFNGDTEDQECWDSNGYQLNISPDEKGSFIQPSEITVSFKAYFPKSVFSTSAYIDTASGTRAPTYMGFNIGGWAEDNDTEKEVACFWGFICNGNAYVQMEDDGKTFKTIVSHQKVRDDDSSWVEEEDSNYMSLFEDGEYFVVEFKDVPMDSANKQDDRIVTAPFGDNNTFNVWLKIWGNGVKMDNCRVYFDDVTVKADGRNILTENFQDKSEEYWVHCERVAKDWAIKPTVYSNTGKASPDISVRDKVTMIMGSTVSLGATSSGDGALTYESDNPEVVTIDSSGTMTAVAEGEAIITVSSSETSSYVSDFAEVAVTVVNKGDPELDSDEDEYTLKVKGTLNLLKKITYKGSGDLAFTSSDTSVATVNSKGKVTAKGVGEAVITVSLSECNDYIADSTQITINVEPASQSISLKKSSKTFSSSSLKKAKKSFTVKVSGVKTSLVAELDSNAKSAKITTKVTDKGVKVTVPKGTAKGTYKITVYAKSSSSYEKSGEKEITIKVS